MAAESVTQAANRLYWESDVSVADIASELDLSRRALYDAIEPLPTGGLCTACGGAVVWPNRTARSAGRAECADCGSRADADEAAADAPPAEDAAFANHDVAAAEPGAARRIAALRARYGTAPDTSLAERALLLGGAALIGVAVGVAAARLLTRDR